MKIYTAMKAIYKKIFSLRNMIFITFFGLFPINKNKIVVSNFWGKGYGDNPKYVVDYLINNYDNIKIVWLLKSNENSAGMPSSIKIVKYKSIRSLYEYATAKVWLDNCRKAYYLKKRKGQYYIQLWHGGVGLKKVEAAAIDTLDNDYIKKAKRDSAMIDYAISNSTYRTNIYKNYFWYDGQVLEYGCPRNDLFFSKDKKNIEKRIRKKYNINKDKKLILYIPTFRKDKNFNYVSINIDKLLKKMEEKYNLEYCFLIKMHPNISEKFEFNNKNIINIASYEDVDELLLISDMIISDYSSVIFDFLFTSNPVYLYAPDYNKYIKERGLNFKYKELPFSISYTSDELIKNIVNNESKAYEEKLIKFLNKVNIIDDGKASQRVAKLIDNIINERI